MAERRILLIQLRQLGDILLSTPCAREIKRDDPSAKITFLSHKMGRLVLDQSPFVDEHLFYDDSMSLFESLRLAQGLRRKKFDMVIDFMGNPRSALFSLVSGAKNRISFQSSRSFCYTRTIPKGGSADYLVREKFRLLREAGFSPQNETLILPWSEKDTGPLLQFMAENDAFRRSPLRVVMSPTHRRENRKWPAARYAELADRLTREWGAVIVWLWGPGPEKEEVEQIRKACKEPSFLAPATNFREMAAFVANADLFIGNSNGPSHVAVAVDTCSIQLHGHTDQRTWCPMSRKHRSIQSAEFGSPGATLDSIKVTDVWRLLEEFQPEIFLGVKGRQDLGVRMSWNFVAL
jgi:ADP-heptose:LPS heptosyltransferase